MPYSEGNEIVYTSYSSKGKDVGSQKMVIKSVSGSGENQDILSEVTLYDKKGKEISNSEVTMICENGVYKMDMSRFVP